MRSVWNREKQFFGKMIKFGVHWYLKCYRLVFPFYSPVARRYWSSTLHARHAIYKHMARNPNMEPWLFTILLSSNAISSVRADHSMKRVSYLLIFVIRENDFYFLFLFLLFLYPWSVILRFFSVLEPCQRFWIKLLKETNLGEAQALFDRYFIPHKTWNQAWLPATVQERRPH